MKTFLLSSLLVLVLLYLAILVVMYMAQRSLQYVPGSRQFETPQAYGLDGFEAVSLTAPDATVIRGWYAPPPSPGAPVVLYLHGNAGTLADREARFVLFREEGFGVLAISWRGFGGSNGSPTEAGLMQDGRTALAFLAGQGVQPQRIVIFGESLGSGVAVQLAADDATRPAALVLDAPFTSTADVARLRYWFLPVGLLMKDQFRSDLFAPKVTVPVMVMHGTADQITPFRFGEQLAGLFAGPVTFFPMQGGRHIEDLSPQSWAAIKAFLAEHGIR